MELYQLFIVLEIMENQIKELSGLKEDYLGKDFTAKETCERKGIKIFYNNRQHGLSSTNLRERVKNAKDWFYLYNIVIQ